MSKRMLGVVAMIFAALLTAALCAPLPVSAQQAQTVYTYASEFEYPRAQWSGIEAGNADVKAILDKAMADGTIISWGDYANMVHHPEQMTHGTFWQSNSIAGLMKVLDELRAGSSSPNSPLTSATRHWDYVLRSDSYSYSTMASRSGYLRVTSAQAKPGKGDDLVAAIKKYFVPAWDQMKADGTLLGYQIDREYIYTEAPSMVYAALFFPDAAALDKYAEGIRNHMMGMSAEDRAAMGKSLDDAAVEDSLRGSLFRISNYEHK